MSERLVALPWIRRDDYDEVRRVMEDGAAWFDSYDDWLKGAEAEEQRAVTSGARVLRVMIEPYEFDVWCAANDMRKDRKGRDAFAAENAVGISQPGH